MRRRFVLPSILTTLLAGTILYVNVWAADPAYSSENPQTTVQESQVADSNPTPAPSLKAQPKPQVNTAKVAKASSAGSKKSIGDTLSIASIGFRAPIINVGVTPDNSIDVPVEAKVGRWIGSARPGSSGAVFLDGHVSGVFANLHKTRVGQIVSVRYGGTSYSYRIVHIETVPLAGIDMTKALSVYGTASEGLNIMTCAGTYMPSQGTYDHRLVVYAVRVS